MVSTEALTLQIVDAAGRQGSAGLAQGQRRNIAYLNERIVLLLGFLGPGMVWATARSRWLLYVLLLLVILLALLWG